MREAKSTIIANGSPVCVAARCKTSAKSSRLAGAIPSAPGCSWSWDRVQRQLAVLLREEIARETPKRDHRSACAHIPPDAVRSRALQPMAGPSLYRALIRLIANRGRFRTVRIVALRV